MRFFFLFLACHLMSAQIADRIAGKVLICGVCRNIESAIPNTIQSIEALGAQFKDYRVLIYENNSHDQTIPLMKKWAKKNPKVLFFSEHVSKKQFAKELAMGTKNRTEVIARARNQILDQIAHKKFADYQYVIWADLDFSTPWDVEHIVETIKQPEQEWDAVLAYGAYDLFAFRDEKCPIGYELVGLPYFEKIEEVKEKFAMQPNEGWRRVYSAFGGLGIYKREAILGCRYSGVVTPDLETLLFSWLKKARTSEEKVPLLKEYEERLGKMLVVDLTKPCLEKREEWPGELGLRLKNRHGKGEVVYFSCTAGTTLPWTCEHVPFHASMILKGRDKIFVNPKIRSGL